MGNYLNLDGNTLTHLLNHAGILKISQYTEPCNFPLVPMREHSTQAKGDSFAVKLRIKPLLEEIGKHSSVSSTPNPVAQTFH